MEKSNKVNLFSDLSQSKSKYLRICSLYSLFSKSLSSYRIQLLGMIDMNTNISRDSFQTNILDKRVCIN